ncbi:MAG TPA: TIGR03564 family F420-dependent LLM class oxidoreductase [Nocardioides sp.]|nr:TIGR03564 family F420-dependent LLM class oxidoreductase [Nocardioides sp.]
MRIGLQIGPERGRYREKVARMIEAAQSAEAQGFDTVWMPQIPDDFDALTALALIGQATSRVELGTAVLPVQSRHPVAMAQQVLSTQAVAEGRLTLGIGPSHHWIVEDMFGLPYEKPARLIRDYVEVLNAAFAGPGKVDVENATYRVHNPFDITDVAPTPILLAALAPLMLKAAGELANGTVLWLADDRAIESHVAPKINAAAEGVGRPKPRIVAGVPVVVCREEEIDGAREWANKALGHAEYSPNYQRLLEHGDIQDVGDMLIAGDESAVAKGLARYRDAGATDAAIRVLPYGSSRDERIASRDRTIQLCADLRTELA